MNDIAPTTKRGLVSGLGITANYIGQFTGLLLALPFSNGSLSLFGSSPRAETLLPAVAVFFVLSLPTLVFFKEPTHGFIKDIQETIEKFEAFKIKKD